MKPNLNEELVVKPIEASNGMSGNLIRPFKWALENKESVKTSRAIELYNLIRSLSLAVVIMQGVFIFFIFYF